MLLIYGTGKVGSAIAALCEHFHLTYHIHDDMHPPASYDPYESIIPSPGVPSHHPIYQTGKVIAELDFAYRYLPKGFQIVSVTGTDGKSTTSWILFSILEKEFSGKKSVYLSGNFDIPFSATVLDIIKKGEKKGIIVLEISSFMSFSLGGVGKDFMSDYTIFTNLQTDHLNWHGSMQEYLDAKMNLVKHTKKKSIFNAQIQKFVSDKSLNLHIPEEVRFFSNEKGRDFTNGEDIIISGRKKYRLSETNFSGGHNALNILSVGILANEMDICAKHIRRYLAEIQGLPHRLELIREYRGIRFVEDSKSTSSQSLAAALSSYGEEKNLLLIVGGSDKGDSFDFLLPQFQKRVKALACIGATKGQFIHMAKTLDIDHISTDSLEEAVSYLYARGEKGDVLMLSPGCASFGLFRDYLDRAYQFRASIQKISD